MAEELESQGETCGRSKAGTLMNLAGVSARQKKKYKATTDSKHNFPVAPNLLDRQFVVKEPNRVWCSDITYIWTGGGWLYLAVIIDLFSRQVIGWSMSIIFHSDRGSQYCSHDFQRMLKGYGMISSMSRKGDCWDNGVPRTPQGDALQEMRVWPLGIGLQDRVPNHVELLR
jgi:transposase InsO family protein